MYTLNHEESWASKFVFSFVSDQSSLTNLRVRLLNVDLIRGLISLIRGLSSMCVLVASSLANLGLLCSF